ncbi:PREDICTED: cyclin-B1-3 isoform X1 [Tarenaya hassleriana]|uniref:cyclin-B1-3 isoform X1 n=2 Tax=Tarenaya hassleriana TaxID=28532 RepID=UPI00053C6451|nr:PREDICTED: cyclin-B1-3 isoform X1 [Tarenaya hassleriana]
MATRPVVPQPIRGDPVVGGEKMQKKNAAVGRNRRALGDIGNLNSLPGVEAGKPQQAPTNRPLTRSFCAQLLANAQQAAGKKQMNVDKASILDGGQAVNKRPAAQRVVQKKAPVVAKQTKATEVIEISPDTNEKVEDDKEKALPLEKKSAQKKVTYSSVLSARSKAACGISNRPKEQVLDIDASDKDNDLAAVEYVEDMYKFYKEVENESRPQMYIHTQAEINEKMRSILVDWLVEVHFKFELSPETLYLTINITDRFLSAKTVPRRELQLVGIAALLMASKYEEIWPPQVNDLVYVTDNAYSSEQILVMEKTILGTLGWYLTVPTQYVFLARFIKAAISDPEMENMVYFLAELGMMNYDTLMFCPSVLAASAVYAARCSLNRSPAWTETLKFHTGYSESQLMDCSKLLTFIHSKAEESKLRAVWKKYSRSERGAVALVAPANSLLSGSADSLVKSV